MFYKGAVNLRADSFLFEIFYVRLYLSFPCFPLIFYSGLMPCFPVIRLSYCQLFRFSALHRPVFIFPCVFACGWTLFSACTYSFMPDVAIPSIKNRCPNKNRIRSGAIEITVAASVGPNLIELLPTSTARPADKVRISTGACQHHRIQQIVPVVHKMKDSKCHKCWFCKRCNDPRIDLKLLHAVNASCLVQ